MIQKSEKTVKKFSLKKQKKDSKKDSKNASKNAIKNASKNGSKNGSKKGICYFDGDRKKWDKIFILYLKMRKIFFPEFKKSPHKNLVKQFFSIKV